eukprot:4467915-Prorocentrum_lima.AAC.1
MEVLVPGHPISELIHGRTCQQSPHCEPLHLGPYAGPTCATTSCEDFIFSSSLCAEGVWLRGT